MNSLIISWGLAALSYDEDNIITHINDLFPGFKCHFKGTSDGDHFYGIVFEEKRGRFWIVNRGTDGYNQKGNLDSWMRNLRLLTSGDGVHNGFQEAGNRVIDDFKHYIYGCSHGYVCGHSQGAGVSQYEVCLLAENFDLDHVHGDVFAAPPTFDNLGAKRFNDLAEDCCVTLDRYVTAGDPIDSNILRNPDGFILKGVDVGNEIVLPTIIGYDLKFANVVKHSCRIYNAGLMQMCAQEDYSREDLKLLSEIGKRIVN